MTTTDSPENVVARAYVAVGSNMGNRFQNIQTAVALLSDPSFLDNGFVKLLHSSMLHETAPMYVTDQPSFLNGVIKIETDLAPLELLQGLKKAEAQLGRDLEGGLRYGPRPVDLDIIFYRQQQPTHGGQGWENVVMDTPDLIIPHPRMAEREFVLAPLCEVANSTLQHPVMGQSVQDLFQTLQAQQNLKDDENEETPERVVVLPLPRDRMLYLNETVVMGILNVTPDSFSDGGKWNASLDLAVERALEMEQEGAGIIDIGGESTRPGAKEVALQEELGRTIPVIERIRHVSDVPISIDTRHAKVARAAVKAGADIVNDVSGGTFDPDMLSTVADLGVPIVLMHMRGTPETMQSFVDDYQDVAQDVTTALLERCSAAEAAGIPRWMQVVDPGIGFAKDLAGNVSLLQNLNAMRSKMGMASTPILLGTSRKGFIGKLTGVEKAEDRDFGTVASCVAAICLGHDSRSFADTCNILRVHNVKAMKEAALVMDAIKRRA